VLTFSAAQHRTAQRFTPHELSRHRGLFPDASCVPPNGICSKSKPGCGHEWALLPASGVEAETVAIKQARENLRVQRAVDLIERLGNFHAFCDHKRDIEKMRRRIAVRDLIANLIPALEF
jgi:hypothetical protein